MRLKAVGLAIAGAIIGMAAPAQAAVKYVYTSSSGAGFTYISTDYYPNGAGYTESCTPFPGAGSCSVSLSIDDNGYGYVLVISNPRMETDIFPLPSFPPVSEFFAPGSFSTLGVHTGLRGGALAVTSDAPSGAPEPATWAMLILGMAGVGGMIRRTRAALA